MIEMVTTPAFWSAVAASMSAVCAFLTFRINRMNLREAVRPELLLGGWSRSDQEYNDFIEVTEVQNIGKGTAFQVRVDSDWSGNVNVAPMSTVHKAIVNAGETASINGRILVNFPYPAGNPGGPHHISSKLFIRYYDSLGILHITEYSLFVSEKPHRLNANDNVAPGVAAERWSRSCVMPSKRGKRTLNSWKRKFDSFLVDQFNL